MATTGRISCHHCPRTTKSSEAGARHLGWRFFKGLSLTGKPLDDVICPVCTGQDAPEPDEIPSWIVECACEWSSYEAWEPGDTPILTAYEAKRVAQTHRCAPEFTFISPSGQRFHEWDKQFRQELEETTPKRTTTKTDE